MYSFNVNVSGAVSSAPSITVQEKIVKQNRSIKNIFPGISAPDNDINPNNLFSPVYNK
jgi:hypothetical protein